MKTLKFGIIFVLVFVAVLYFILSPIKNLLVYFLDDSYFYLKIAQNVAQGYGSTFDRVNITNGYHPFWLIILSGYFLLTKLLIISTPESFLRAVCILHLAIFLSTTFVVKKICDTINPNQSNFKTVLIFSVLSSLLIYLRDFGFETHIGCLLIAVYIYIKAREIFRNESFMILKSVLLICLFLTRTDYIFSIIPVIILFELMYSSERKIYKHTLVLIIPLLSVVIIYLYFNYTYFGNFQTAPAYLKNSFPHFLFVPNLIQLFQDHSYNQIVKLSFMIICLTLFVYRMRTIIETSNDHKFDLFVLFLGFGGVLFFIMHLSFNYLGIAVWNATVPAFISIILFLRLIQSQLKYFRFLFGLLVILFVFYLYQFRINDGGSRGAFSYDYAKKLKEVTNADDRIYQIDLTGIVGYFSERNVINGDRLVNSFEYIQYIANNNLENFLKEENINFYSTHSGLAFGMLSKNLHGKDYLIDTVHSGYGGFDFIFLKKNLILSLVNPQMTSIKNNVTKWYLLEFD